MNLAERLRLKLAGQNHETLPPMPGDTGYNLAEDGLVPAAVLVAITDRPEPGLLLTLRTAHLRKHAGQVAFPGGRIDPGDSGPIAAALREAEEEIGLPPSKVDIIGTTDRYRTVTGFVVTPVIAIVPPDLVLSPHAEEVAAVFEARLSHVLDPANRVLREQVYQGSARSYYEIYWEEFRIWGATAAMIVNLAARIGTAA